MFFEIAVNIVAIAAMGPGIAYFLMGLATKSAGA